MKKLVLVLVAGIVGIAMAVGVSVSLSSENTVEAKKAEDAVLEFTIETSPDTSVGEVVDAVRKAANIGSSGEDGFRIDSFFDISYAISPSADGTRSAVGIVTIEIHAAPNSSDINPGTVIDNVRAAVGGKGGYIGHVTLLK
jgi:hypothetical protein